MRSPAFATTSPPTLERNLVILMVMHETARLLKYISASPDDTFERDVNNAIKKHYGIFGLNSYNAKNTDSDHVQYLASQGLLYDDGKPGITVATYREI